MKTSIARIWTEQLLSRSIGRQPGRRPSGLFLRNFFTSTQRTTCSRLQHKTFQQTALLHFRFQRSALARRIRSVRSKSDQSRTPHVNPTPHLGSPEPAQSLSQRLKQLSKEYGWTAVGVYLGLSLVDFPFCFLAVRLLGTDRIGHYEDVVKEAFWSVVRLVLPEAGKKSAATIAAEEELAATAREGSLESDALAVRHNSGADASTNLYPAESRPTANPGTAIWTQLGLAYLVHKSLIFFRVPLTAAVLPKVVKTLRSWGYNVGRKKVRPS